MSTVLISQLSTLFNVIKRLVPSRHVPQSPEHDEMLRMHEARKREELHKQQSHRNYFRCCQGGLR